MVHPNPIPGDSRLPNHAPVLGDRALLGAGFGGAFGPVFANQPPVPPPVPPIEAGGGSLGGGRYLGGAADAGMWNDPVITGGTPYGGILGGGVGTYGYGMSAGMPARQGVPMMPGGAAQMGLPQTLGMMTGPSPAGQPITPGETYPLCLFYSKFIPAGQGIAPGVGGRNPPVGQAAMELMIRGYGGMGLGAETPASLAMRALERFPIPHPIHPPPIPEQKRRVLPIGPPASFHPAFYTLRERQEMAERQAATAQPPPQQQQSMQQYPTHTHSFPGSRGGVHDRRSTSSSYTSTPTGGSLSRPIHPHIGSRSFSSSRSSSYGQQGHAHPMRETRTGQATHHRYHSLDDSEPSFQR